MLVSRRVVVVVVVPSRIFFCGCFCPLFFPKDPHEYLGSQKHFATLNTKDKEKGVLEPLCKQHKRAVPPDTEEDDEEEEEEDKEERASFVSTTPCASSRP